MVSGSEGIRRMSEIGDRNLLVQTSSYKINHGNQKYSMGNTVNDTVITV